MRHLFLLLTITTAGITALPAQQLTLAAVNAAALQLDDVMELTDTSLLKTKLHEVEAACKQHPTELNRIRLGIIHHETALNFSFLHKTSYTGYAQRSYDTLSAIVAAPGTTPAFMPFVAAYRASALALVAGETGKLDKLSAAFVLFDTAVARYAGVSALPEFLRGSVAENLPWYFVRKHKAARGDFRAIIKRYEANANYATPKLMSFTYWAWANGHQGKKDRPEALRCLERAIALDTSGTGGRSRAEGLKAKLSR